MTIHEADKFATLEIVRILQAALERAERAHALIMSVSTPGPISAERHAAVCEHLRGVVSMAAGAADYAEDAGKWLQAGESDAV